MFRPICIQFLAFALLTRSASVVACDDPDAVGSGEVAGSPGKTIEQTAATSAIQEPASDRERAKELVEVLGTGIEWLNSQSGYTAHVVMQERIPGGIWAEDLAPSDVRQGKVTAEEHVHLKLRHEPFSTYMKWLTARKGRELLYVDERDNDRLLVYSPKARRFGLSGTLSLATDGRLVKKERRYPITKFGMLVLAERLRAVLTTDLDGEIGKSTCELISDCRFDGRPANLYILEHDRPQLNTLYRKAIIHMDREWMIPVAMTAYTWPPDGCKSDDVDKVTFIERYEYSNIDFESPPNDIDFDSTNPAYRFRRSK